MCHRCEVNFGGTRLVSMTVRGPRRRRRVGSGCGAERRRPRVAVDRASVLRELHDLHGAVIWRYAVHLTRNPSTADDIVQETLLRAWKTPRILDQDPASVRFPLFTVSPTLVIDAARSAP